MKAILLIHAFLALSTAYGKLIDKTIAVVDKEVLTLSEVQQIKRNINARKNISPQIYSKKNYTTADIVESFIKSRIIRNNLERIGFVIKDSQVESQIKQTESNLRVDRDELLQFLRSNKVSFEEYFNITKETIEFNIFLARIIKPLIKITNFELKNEFSKNSKLSSDTFNYTLVDFYVNQRSISTSKLKTIRKDLIKFQKDGILPKYLKNLETNVLENVKEEGLSSQIKKSLIGKSVEEFSEPVIINNYVHLFYIKKKSLVESEKYSNSKRTLEQNIFMAKSANVISKWLDQEKTKYFIKVFL